MVCPSRNYHNTVNFISNHIIVDHWRCKNTFLTNKQNCLPHRFTWFSSLSVDLYLRHLAQPRFNPTKLYFHTLYIRVANFNCMWHNQESFKPKIFFTPYLPYKSELLTLKKCQELHQKTGKFVITSKEKKDLKIIRKTWTHCNIRQPTFLKEWNILPLRDWEWFPLFSSFLQLPCHQNCLLWLPIR